MSATLDRIKKLLNLANCDGAAPNEADVARSLAERLMAAAGLTERDVASFSEEDILSSFGSTVEPIGRKSVVRWMGIVAMAVSRITGAFCHWDSSPMGKTLIWVGTSAQRETAIELFDWVCKQIERLSNQARKSAVISGSPKSWLNSYRLGVASSIATQAVTMVQTHKAAAGRPDEKAMVLSSKLSDALSSYKKTKHLRGTGKSAVSNGSAYAAGQNDGNSVRLRNDLGGNGVKRLNA